MTKVKITQEQATALEYLLNTKWSETEFGATDWDRESIIIHHCGNYKGWVDEASPLNGMDPRKLINALYEGYEVEPKFESGDWIHRKFKDGVRVAKALNVYDDNIIQFHDDEELPNIKIDGLTRHATQEEITVRKRQKWWSKFDRDVLELRKDDILISEYGKLYVVASVDNSPDSKVRFINGGFEYTHSFFGRGFYENGWRVVCFSENRGDINGGVSP